MLSTAMQGRINIPEEYYPQVFVQKAAYAKSYDNHILYLKVVSRGLYRHGTQRDAILKIALSC